MRFRAIFNFIYLTQLMKCISLDLMNCCIYPHLALLSLIMRTTLPRVFGALSPVLGGHMRHGPPKPL